MNIILNKMPNFLTVDREHIPIDSGFRTWIRFDEALFWNNEPLERRIYSALNICYTDRIPSDINNAIYAALEFYACSNDAIEEFRTETRSEQGQNGRNNQAYSFTHDASLICAAFRAQYDIDLTKDDLHWWHFKALFEGLTNDNGICKVMEIRGTDLSKIKDKETKAHYRKLKRLYRLPDPRSEEEKELAMIDALSVMF